MYQFASETALKMVEEWPCSVTESRLRSEADIKFAMITDHAANGTSSASDEEREGYQLC